MKVRNWTLAVMAAMALAACGKGEAPAPKAAAAPEAAKAAQVPAAATAPATAPEAVKAEAAKPAEAPVPALDKDKLAKCYTAVYCAQKKGEMDKILGIYKEFGFETPQSFTKTWIEAAKDTDWVTKIAHEVGKKCP
jgi:hypothetical protein